MYLLSSSGFRISVTEELPRRCFFASVASFFASTGLTGVSTGASAATVCDFSFLEGAMVKGCDWELGE
jgi:hypothetical protein